MSNISNNMPFIPFPYDPRYPPIPFPCDPDYPSIPHDLDLGNSSYDFSNGISDIASQANTDRLLPNNPQVVPNEHISKHPPSKKRKISTVWLSSPKLEIIHTLCLAVLKSKGGASFWETIANHYNGMKQNSMPILNFNGCSNRMQYLEQCILKTKKLPALAGLERWKTVAKIWLDNQEKNKRLNNQSLSDNQNKSPNATKKAKNHPNTSPHSNSSIEHTSSETEQSNMPKTKEPHDVTPAPKRKNVSRRSSLSKLATLRTLCVAVIESISEKALGRPSWRKISKHYNKIKQVSMKELDEHQCATKMGYIEKQNISKTEELQYSSEENRWRRVAQIWLDKQEKK